MSSQSRPGASHNAFVANFSSGHRRVYAYVSTLVPDPNDADDIMQETSIVLWSKWSQFDPESDFVRWACGIARLEVLRFLRQKRKKGGIVISEAMIEMISAEFHRKESEDLSRFSAFRECLAELDRSQHDLVTRHYRGDANIQQLAEERDCTSRTVYNLLGRVRTRIRNCIRKRLAAEGQSR